MRISAFCTAVLTCVVIGPAPAVAQVDQQRAQEFFKEAQALCERDGGRLWGVSLCGPMVIADLKSQTLATSQPEPVWRLAFPRSPAICSDRVDDRQGQESILGQNIAQQQKPLGLHARG